MAQLITDPATGVKKRYTNNGEVRVSSSVSDGTSKNKRMDTAKAVYARTTNGRSWTAADNVKQFFITCFAPSALAANTDVNSLIKNYVLLLIDVEAEGSCSSAFALIGASNANVEYHPIPYGVKIGPFQVQNEDDYFTYVDVKPTIDDTLVFIEAN